jgi:Flp pilus assembly pilin Flp
MKTELTTAATDGNEHSLRGRLLRDQRGASLVEYAMLAGMIAIAAFTAFRAFGGNVRGAVQEQADQVQTINNQ